MWWDGASSGGALRPGSDVGRDGWCWFDQGKENCGSPEKKKLKVGHYENENTHDKSKWNAQCQNLT